MFLWIAMRFSEALQGLYDIWLIFSKFMIGNWMGPFSSCHSLRSAAQTACGAAHALDTSDLVDLYAESGQTLQGPVLGCIEANFCK